MNNYYHAGTMSSNQVRWSDATRRTASAAEKEAKRMAKQYGGKPVVEYWDRSHGLRPGDANVVEGAYDVQ